MAKTEHNYQEQTLLKKERGDLTALLDSPYQNSRWATQHPTRALKEYRNIPQGNSQVEGTAPTN
jgi:hypothetical protein